MNRTTFGSSREKLIGLHIDNIPNKKFAKEVYKSLSGKTGHFEGEYISLAGKKTSYIKAIWIPIKQKGKILSGVGIVEDITKRKKAEEALRHYKRAVECSADIIAGVDRDYTYLFANKAYLEHHQLKEEQVIGHHFGNVVGKPYFENNIKSTIIA